MEFNEKEIKGVYEIQLNPHCDDRGFFMRTYDEKIFKEHNLNREWAQENHSLSKFKHTVRGIHFQFKPDTETKLLRVITGEIFFVVVDLRKNSSTFGKWISVVLSGEKKNLLYIPRGCVPGMCTLTDNCHLAYKVDNYYASNNEAVLKWNDPDIGIYWPTNNPAVISDRDSKGMSFKEFVEKHGGLEQ
ncbi:dTDP-4-dehydrorhamnose 3,5-epimerase [archaeon]|jgi:dTDP-4-dehydrorhamnose 3,5-epimerase|nr:dTDP-4-dehydrorhamnose 3,5-epimerase [archaeon]MBT3451363.1 dTDP-4-dehydrorhamnose 3,5-epimerase [archaeon]MBT6869321.1 dTDP-4-dehydrorhamnose 3,5-epimerase [archaeon]MBT7192484.1 dTDP-4-dehydrorhamnose 3,5-epimerase [archaeon]MBT7380560.1 dTDP-4-dehydrorhamnose 3,5-epimerase [archaeon]